MAVKIKREVVLETVECGACGTWHAIPESMMKEAHRSGALWYCPRGHHIGYSESENDRLQKALDQQKIQLSQAKADAEWQRSCRERAEASLSATRGVVTRLKKRVGNGVCPCCGRTFQQLARHMASQHPGWAEEPSDA